MKVIFQYILSIQRNFVSKLRFKRIGQIRCFQMKFGLFIWLPRNDFDFYDKVAAKC